MILIISEKFAGQWITLANIDQFNDLKIVWYQF